jgi:hypothetical protein
MSIVNGTPSMQANLGVFSQSEMPAMIDRTSIDCALLEVLAAASLMVNSPDVATLELEIHQEITHT